jgi:hypothetical protein
MHSSLREKPHRPLVGPSPGADYQVRGIAPLGLFKMFLQTQASSWRGDFAVIEVFARSFAVAPVRMLVRDDPADIERAIASFAQQPNGGLICRRTASHRSIAR